MFSDDVTTDILESQRRIEKMQAIDETPEVSNHKNPYLSACTNDSIMSPIQRGSALKEKSTSLT